MTEERTKIVLGLNIVIRRFVERGTVSALLLLSSYSKSLV